MKIRWEYCILCYKYYPDIYRNVYKTRQISMNIIAIIAERKIICKPIHWYQLIIIKVINNLLGAMIYPMKWWEETRTKLYYVWRYCRENFKKCELSFLNREFNLFWIFLIFVFRKMEKRRTKIHLLYTIS